MRLGEGLGRRQRLSAAPDPHQPPSEASPLTAEPELASSTGRGSGRGNMAALCAGDVTVQLVPPSHVVQAALTALKSRLRGVGPVALRDMDALCIKDWSKIRPLS